MLSQDRPARCVPSADWATLWNEISRAPANAQPWRWERCNNNTHRQTLRQPTRCSHSDAWRLAQVVALPLQVQHSHTVNIADTPIVLTWICYMLVKVITLFHQPDQPNANLTEDECIHISHASPSSCQTATYTLTGWFLNRFSCLREYCIHLVFLNGNQRTNPTEISHKQWQIA